MLQSPAGRANLGRATTLSGHRMAEAIGKTLAQMTSAPFLWVLARALALTLVLYAGLFWLFQLGLGALPASRWGWLDWAVRILANAGLIFSFFFLLFPVAALFVGLFLEEVAGAVERRHYPGDPPAVEPGLLTGLTTGLRFFFALVALNFLLLPVYLFVPAINVGLFFAVNGYLIGREYFELVALRHMPEARVRVLRRRYRGRILGAGLTIAIPLTIPLVNLVAPLFGAALMVHVFKDIERRAGDDRI